MDSPGHAARPDVKNVCRRAWSKGQA